MEVKGIEWPFGSHGETLDPAHGRDIVCAVNFEEGMCEGTGEEVREFVFGECRIRGGLDEMDFVFPDAREARMACAEEFLFGIEVGVKPDIDGLIGGVVKESLQIVKIAFISAQEAIFLFILLRARFGMGDKMDDEALF